MQLKKYPKPDIRIISLVILLLWCMVIAGFLAVSIMSMNCLQNQNCPSEFLEGSEELGGHFLQIEFGLFFFFFMIFEVDLPTGILHSLKTKMQQAIWIFSQLISPPPRLSIY